MKHIFLIFTLLLPFWGSAGFAQTGMTVFGDVSIGENTTLVVAEDELTLFGDLTGEGEVRMAGKKTQTIHASDRAIDRLVVANPKAVKVTGKLTVRKSVTVEQGDLIVTSQAELVLLPQAQIRLATGSKLVRVDAVFQTGQEGVVVEQQEVVSGVLPTIRPGFPDRTTGWRVALKPSGKRQKPYREPCLTTCPLPPWQKLSGTEV